MTLRHDTGTRFEWALALVVLLLGLYVSQDAEARWVAIGVAVHALPLLSLILPWRVPRRVLLWYGVFLILQGVYSLHPARVSRYMHLPAHLELRFRVSGDILRGIEGLQEVRTDGRGYRVSAAVDYSASAPYRVFAIGASTTEQIYLGNVNTWTHLLQERLGPGTEVINTGASGLRAEHHLVTFHQIRRLHPDMAFFLVGVNDWNKHIREQFGSRFYQRSKFRDSLLADAIRSGLPALRRRIEGEEDAPIRLETGDHYRDRIGALSRRPRTERWFPDDVAPDYRAAMERIASACRRTPVTCVFSSQPHGYAEPIDEAYKRQLWMTPPNEAFTLDLPSLIHVAGLYNEYLRQFSCDNGFHFIDLAAQMPPGFASFYDDVHFNEGGARRVAEVLAPEIGRIMAGAPTEACPRNLGPSSQPRGRDHSPAESGATPLPRH
jgi:lysophospholipase L1-like esterase